MRQTTERGPVREIDATPARTHYRVAGVEQTWCDDAQRLLLSAFRAEKAYDTSNRNLKTWDATVHLTGSRDGVPTEIRVKANNVRYDDATAEVFFEQRRFVVRGRDRRQATRARSGATHASSSGAATSGRWK